MLLGIAIVKLLMQGVVPSLALVALLFVVRRFTRRDDR